MDLLLDEVGRGQVGLPAGKLVVDRLYLRVADLHTSHTPHDPHDPHDPTTSQHANHRCGMFAAFGLRKPAV